MFPALVIRDFFFLQIKMNFSLRSENVHREGTSFLYYQTLQKTVISSQSILLSVWKIFLKNLNFTFITQKFPTLDIVYKVDISGSCNLLIKSK